MENQHRINPTSLLFEARHRLRTHLAVETQLLQRTDQLPEDDFCHFSRESLQLGAGFAWLQAESDAFPEEDEILPVAIEAFLSSRPKNRHLDEETRQAESAAFTETLLKRLDNSEEGVVPPFLSPYEIEAAEAFVDGYLTVYTSLPALHARADEAMAY